MMLLTACHFAMSTPEQVLLIEHSKGGERLGAASAQVAFNLGNARSAFLGLLPIKARLPCNYTALTGTFFAFAGFILPFTFVRKYGVSGMANRQHPDRPLESATCPRA